MSTMAETFDRLGGVSGVREDPLRPLAEHEVEAIEHVLMAPLPRQYRDFLLTFGAIGFERAVGCMLLEPLCGNTEPSIVEPFIMYGADVMNDSINGVLENFYVFRDRMPETVFPIGEDIFGNQFCLGFAGDEYNKVYFWDHEGEWTAWDEHGDVDYGEPVLPNLYEGLYLVANSFEEFIDRLERSDDEEEEEEE